MSFHDTNNLVELVYVKYLRAVKHTFSYYSSLYSSFMFRLTWVSPVYSQGCSVQQRAIPQKNLSGHTCWDPEIWGCKIQELKPEFQENQPVIDWRKKNNNKNMKFTCEDITVVAVFFSCQNFWLTSHLFNMVCNNMVIPGILTLRPGSCIYIMTNTIYEEQHSWVKVQRTADYHRVCVIYQQHRQKNGLRHALFW